MNTPKGSRRKITPTLRVKVAKRGLELRAERYKRRGIAEPRTPKIDLPAASQPQVDQISPSVNQYPNNPPPPENQAQPPQSPAP